MSNKRGIIKSLLSAFFADDSKPFFSAKTDGNLENERRYFYKFLQSQDKEKEIGVSTEKGRNLLWFRRKKH